MRRALAISVALTLLALPSLASADYEQVPEHFGVSGEAEQLKNSLGMAVNEDGEGGVEPGSFYVVGRNTRVVRFTPGKEGEGPQFEEAWGWGIAVGGPGSAYVRCGPAYEGTANPAEGTYEHCNEPPPNAQLGGEEPGHFETLQGVAVHQTTGNVYVRNFPGLTGEGKRQHHLIEVFTATGTPVGEGFGDSAKESPADAESIANAPEKVHATDREGGAIAVDEAGTVYLNDSDYPGVKTPQTRAMSFRPETPGDYEHYVYAAGNDVAAGSSVAFSRVALIGSNRLVVANQLVIREYEIGGAAAPLCSLPITGQLRAMTANRLSGEVFYLSLIHI